MQSSQCFAVGPLQIVITAANNIADPCLRFAKRPGDHRLSHTSGLQVGDECVPVHLRIITIVITIVNTNVIKKPITIAIMTTFKDRLIEARTEAKLTQKELGERVGVTQSTIGNLEAGTRNGTTKIAEIAFAVGVDALWLATGEGEKKRRSYSADPKIAAAIQMLEQMPERDKDQAIKVIATFAEPPDLKAAGADGK